MIVAADESGEKTICEQRLLSGWVGRQGQELEYLSSSSSSSSPFIFVFTTIIITHKFRGSEENRGELPRCVFIIALPPVLATSGCLFAAFPCCTLVHPVSDDHADDDDALPKMIIIVIYNLYNIFLHFVHFVKEEVSWWTYQLFWQCSHWTLWT